MNDKTKKDFIQLFNQGFEEIILPEIETIRDDVSTLKDDVGVLRTRVTQIDNKLDVMNDKILDHGNKIKNIERIPAIAHDLKNKKSK